MQLHGDGKLTPALELYADDDGIVRFYCKPNQPPETILKLVLDCKVGDRVTHYSSSASMKAVDPKRAFGSVIGKALHPLKQAKD